MKTVADYLRYAPKGTKLYSPLFGECTLRNVSIGDSIYVFKKDEDDVYCFTKDGCFFEDHEEAECLLFPSKDNRSWADFEYRHQFKPFDRVVVRTSDDVKKDWHCSVFSHVRESGEYPYIMITGFCYKHCLPFNEETAKLIGTTDELNG